MIEIEGLRKRLNGETVLDGVDLTVHEGETLVLLGPSGTGKSVLLKHVLGLFDPDSGDVRVEGISVPRADARHIRRVRSLVSYVFQDSALFDSLTVGENLRMGLDDPGRGPVTEPEREAIREMLVLVNLELGVLDLLPSELSGGMQKRVAVARAVLGSQRYILYDEPTTGLDPVNASLVKELIRRCEQEACATNVIVTHDLDLAFSLADRIALMMDGDVRARGTPDELRSSRDPAVRRFLNGNPDDDSARREEGPHGPHEARAESGDDPRERTDGKRGEKTREEPVETRGEAA